LWRTILASVGALVALIATLFALIALVVFVAVECSPPEGDAHVPSYARPYELTGAVGRGVVGNEDAEAYFYFYATNAGVDDVRAAIRSRLVAHHWRVVDESAGDVGDPWYAASDGTRCLQYIAFDQSLVSRVELAPEPAYRGQLTLKQIVGSRSRVLAEIGDFAHLVFIAAHPCEPSTSG
jgi:hypothetical protein